MTAPATDRQTWWESLRHSGLLLSPGEVARLEKDHAPADLPFFRLDQLRRELNRRDAGDLGAGELATFVLTRICGFDRDDDGTWQRGNAITTSESRTLVTGQVVRPRQVWTGRKDGKLPVFVDDSKTLGLGRGRKAVSDIVQWLRLSHLPLALITNGRQWRLVFAGLDFEAACEWDTDLWFEEGQPGPQLEALRLLLQPSLWNAPERGGVPILVEAIQASRRGQSELSAILGERVREAVELLVRAHGQALTRLEGVENTDIYRAAVRVVMRMVFVLFAESRDLLPRSNPLYHHGYGIQGLFERLQRLAARGRGRLTQRHSAWPHVLGLFRLVHDGSAHSEVTVPAYGGGLFTPGDADSSEPLSRALSVFESACFDATLEPVSDQVVQHVLELLTRTKVRVRQGRGTTTTTVPVDFSGLSSEYIGILYEGLLDYELRTAPEDDPIVFLAVGNEPALPLAALQRMEPKQIKDLFEKLKDKSSAGDEGAEEDAEDDASEQEESPPEGHDEVSLEDDDAELEDEEATESPPAAEAARQDALEWAIKAVKAAKLVRTPRGKKSPEKLRAYDRLVEAKAKQLRRRVVLPGEWFLVRWGGTRKGSGTFYTRPQLAVPTVHRTLRPLAYDPPVGEDGQPDLDAPADRWTAKKPEEILALKVCDPACGSGSFPVAALRFLTDAVYTALHAHDRIREDWQRPLDELLGLVAPGDADERLEADRLPCRPDAADFEPRAKAMLRRYVVERCVYGVDLDPLAVELCKLTLWIDTMDRDLPFSFLDHKVKCGNSLVGAWFDQFQHFPVMAWKNRAGGDKGHSNGKHYAKEQSTKALKAFVTNTLTPDLNDALRGQMRLYAPPAVSAAEVHDHAMNVLERLHAMPSQDTAEKARFYREELLGSAAWNSLKAAMDLWCACWFWPTDDLDDAPIPSEFAEPTEPTIAVAQRLAADQHFFHWELEFPDVFNSPGSGFDALLGNPPWEVAKPNSMEFFSNIDPLYRTYGKQEALKRQRGYFESIEVESSWLDYNAGFRAQSNFAKYTCNAFGDPIVNESSSNRFSIARGKAGGRLHAKWRAIRQESDGYADVGHPFQHQGSADFNLYKLFLEQAHALLRPGGRLGFLVPSGIYSDRGTTALRTLFLDRCSWEWLFGFENRDKIFDIDSRFKFNPVIVRKGGHTEAIRTAFMRRDPTNWEEAESHATPYTRDRVTQFSPRSRAILEIQSARDLETLETIYSDASLFADSGDGSWHIDCGREFHMTDDVSLFPSRTKWEAKGFCPDEYSRWVKAPWKHLGALPTAKPAESTGPEPAPTVRGRVSQPSNRSSHPPGIVFSRGLERWTTEDEIQGVALPFMQGVMVHQFDFSYSGWLSGTGLKAKWERLEWADKDYRPQYLMDPVQRKSLGSRLLYRRVARSTDARTMIASLDPGNPAGDKVPTASTGDPFLDLCLVAVLNSLVVDSILRTRCGGTNIDLSSMEELPLPSLSHAAWPSLASLAFELNCASWLFAPTAIRASQQRGLTYKSLVGPRRWRLQSAERLRARCELDASIAALFGLSARDLGHILEGCDLDLDQLARKEVRTSLNARGFWRVDKNKDPELRHTVLTLVAFHELQQSIEACDGDRDKGIQAFLAQNDGDGWMLPETLCLADYGLGHGARALVHQPVASRLGPRFLDWQHAQSPGESWRECHLHARNQLGHDGYLQLLADVLRDAEPSSWRSALEPAYELDSKPALLTVLCHSFRPSSPDAWKPRLDHAQQIMTEREFSPEPSDRVDLLLSAVRLALRDDDTQSAALDAARSLLDEAEHRMLLEALEEDLKELEVAAPKPASTSKPLHPNQLGLSYEEPK